MSGTLPIANPAAAPESRFNLFQLLPPPARDDFLTASRLRSFVNGAIIYSQGDTGTEMFRIVTGNVRLSLLHADGRELVFVTYEPGDCFGISTLIDGLPFPHTAEAHGPVQVQAVSYHAVNALRARHRSIDEALLQLLCRHLRILSSYFADATLGDLVSRVARRLIAVARPHEPTAPVVHLSQAELALMFGVSRQTMNKLLRQLEDEGILKLSYGAIELIDTPALGQYAASE